jgi:thiosulfate/3-mercaptopyruvate sulfurtransferase
VTTTDPTGVPSASFDDAIDVSAATRTPAVAAALAGPLVSTQWLADHLGSEGLVVLDATVVPEQTPEGRLAYESDLERFLTDGHIPGAVFADVIERFSDSAAQHPFTRPDAESFAAAARALGVDADSTVVVYDTAAGQWASRLWYLFRSFGHDRVAVLDGGGTKWRAEERPVAVALTESAEAEVFVAVEQDDFWVGAADVAAIVAGTRPGTLVCGTPPRDFAARHIPGSVSAPAVRLIDRDTNAFLAPSALRVTFADVLGAPGPIVAYCAGGIAATADALALALLGRDDVVVYDGSLNEWAADPDAPLASAA